MSGCGYETPGVLSEIVMLQLLKMHEADHRLPVRIQQPTVDAPKLNRSFIDIGIDEEAWLSFVPSDLGLVLLKLWLLLYCSNARVKGVVQM